MLTNNEKTRAIALLKDILSISSVNSQDDEGKLAGYLLKYLQDSGISGHVEYIENRCAYITAKVTGMSRDKIVLCGHLDTVPFGNKADWNTPPDKPTLRHGRIYGRGASDMKSGLAAILYSIAKISEMGIQPKNDILFIGTADEEKNGFGAYAAVKAELMDRAKVLFIAEPTDGQIGLSQKGCIWIKLSVHGKIAHSALPSEGINAAEWAFEIAKRIQEKVRRFSDPLLGSTTASITNIHAGVANNMIPGVCDLILDLRTVPGLDHMKLLELIDDICRDAEKAAGSLTIDRTILNERIPVTLDSKHEEAGKFLDIVKKTLNKDVKIIGVNYFTDASIIQKAFPQVPVILYGPGMVKQMHQTNEYVEVSQYLDSIDVYCRMLTD